MVFRAGREAASVAQFKGNIIIRISIKILFKSYLLIEYIPAPQYGGQSFVSKKEKGLLNSANRNQVITFGFISTCTFLWLAWVLRALHYSKPGLRLSLRDSGPKETESLGSAPGSQPTEPGVTRPDWAVVIG